MAPNHSKFAALEEDHFLAGSRVLSAMEKVGRTYLKKEFRRDCRNFLEDFVNCVLSTVAARSAIGQGVSCFCPLILVDGDDHAPINSLTCCVMEAAGERMGEGHRDGSLQVRVPVVRARAEAAGADFS